MRARRAVVSGIGAALILVLITSYRLERPGAYYDELHQAPAAFAYVGRPTSLFSFMPIGGLPLMNMSYTGAIKSAIFGVYMRQTGRPFTLWSWRLLGILFSATGVMAFCALAGGRMAIGALLMFLGLLLTDTNLLLQSRNDWGPVALGFLLRMLLLGLAVRHLTGARRSWSPFLLGLVTGIAIFEKLSSAVLLGPLAIVLVADPASRTVRAVVQTLAGLVAGALPAIAVNVYSLLTTSSLVALASVDTTPRRSILGYAANYLFLGNGGLERRMIFDTSPLRWTEPLEGLAIVSLILIVSAVTWKRRSADVSARLAGACLLCYLAVGAALPFLPHGTAEHHWILGTPFQYLAIALAAPCVWTQRAFGTIGRSLFAASLALLLAARAPVLVSAFDAVQGDQYTRAWDPSLNTAAEFAARQPQDAIFIAANWGTATQAFCFSNGRQQFVFEPYPFYGGPETLNPILAPPERQLVIAAAIRPAAPLRPGEINTLRQVTAAIFRDLATSNGWEEVPADPAVRDLRAVELRVFRRRKPPFP
jgi:hypothetical protein